MKAPGLAPGVSRSPCAPLALSLKGDGTGGLDGSRFAERAPHLELSQVVMHCLQPETIYAIGIQNSGQALHRKSRLPRRRRPRRFALR